MLEVLKHCPALGIAALGGCPGAAPCVCASQAMAVTMNSPPVMTLEARNSRRQRALSCACVWHQNHSY